MSRKWAECILSLNVKSIFFRAFLQVHPGSDIWTPFDLHCNRYIRHFVQSLEK